MRVPPRMLFADDKGNVFDHPFLAAAARVGRSVAPIPEDAWIPLPAGSRVVMLPGRAPVGIDDATHEPESLERIPGRSARALAVAAVLPPAFVRTNLPAFTGRARAPELPQWAYTAMAMRGSRPVVAAIRIDRRTRWDPRRTTHAALARAAAARAREIPGNSLIAQVTKCALEYHCVTAQNIILRRDEGALPVSAACNARCAGCLSRVDPGGAPASHERIGRPPTPTEIADVATAHLRGAARPMVSFGQGCEGEPLLAARVIEPAIHEIRARTRAGRININTNGSIPTAVARLIDAGLDHIRVSLNSARPPLYEAYYRPAGYTLADVTTTIDLAGAAGITTTLNLLTFPGVTDREAEVAALADVVSRHRVDLVQLRNLAIDPAVYWGIAEGAGAGARAGAAIGIRELIRRLDKARPGLRFGCFNLARVDAR